MATNKPNSLSSSSPPILGRQNPRLRNSEAIDPMRRSVGSNLFAKPSVNANLRGFNNTNPTPANSPSDFARRNSFGRDMSQSHHDSVDKENDRGHIPNVARAPPTPKGAKNFMSPTISAASKINPSPRKKILAEKTEPARHSVSFSDVISIIGADNESMKPKMQTEEQQHDLTITDLDLKGTLLDSEFDPDSSFKMSPRPPCSNLYPHYSVAPLDADPLMPPYDPKTNYLSPRPRFLHYKPNPKVELELNEGKQLEEIFASQSSSDTEVSETETDSVTSGIHSEDDVSQRVESGNEEETVDDEEQEEETVDDEEQEEEHAHKVTTERKGPREKAHGFGTSKVLVWLLVLAAVCSAFSAAFYLRNQKQLSMLQDSSFFGPYVPSEVTEFARSNFEQLGDKFKTWSESSFVYILKLIPGVAVEKERGPLQFLNLTDLFEDQSFDYGFRFTRDEAIVAEQNDLEMEEISEIDADEDEIDEIDEFEEPRIEEEDSKEDNIYDVVPEDELQQENVTEGTEHHNKEEQKQELVETDNQQQDTKAEVGSDVASEIQLPEESEIGLDDKVLREEEVSQNVVQASEAPKLNAELITILEYELATKASDDNIITEELSQAVVVQASDAALEIDEFITIPESESEDEMSTEIDIEEYGSQEPDEMSSVLANLSSVKNVFLVSLTMLSFGAAAAFFFSKKAKRSTPVPAASLDDETRELFPPDTSSRFQKNCSVYSRRGLEEEPSEAHSHERRRNKNNNSYNKMESLASSASEYSVSHSYGSFTTYEKIPIKIGNGDEEEVITPVRRSSRLRYQASSSSAH